MSDHIELSSPFTHLFNKSRQAAARVETWLLGVRVSVSVSVC